MLIYVKILSKNLNNSKTVEALQNAEEEKSEVPLSFINQFSKILHASRFDILQAVSTIPQFVI